MSIHFLHPEALITLWQLINTVIKKIGHSWNLKHHKSLKQSYFNPQTPKMLNDDEQWYKILMHRKWATESVIYLSLCLPFDGLHCDWMRLMKEEEQSCLQVVVGGVQIHLSLVGGVYPSFCLARSREKKTSQMFLKDFSNVYVLLFSLSLLTLLTKLGLHFILLPYILCFTVAKPDIFWVHRVREYNLWNIIKY